MKGALIGQGRARLWLSAPVYYQFAPGKAPWVLTPNLSHQLLPKMQAAMCAWAHAPTRPRADPGPMSNPLGTQM